MSIRHLAFTGIKAMILLLMSHTPVSLSAQSCIGAQAEVDSMVLRIDSTFFHSKNAIEFNIIRSQLENGDAVCWQNDRYGLKEIVITHYEKNWSITRTGYERPPLKKYTFEVFKNQREKLVFEVYQGQNCRWIHIIKGRLRGLPEQLMKEVMVDMLY